MSSECLSSALGFSLTIVVQKLNDRFPLKDGIDASDFLMHEMCIYTTSEDDHYVQGRNLARKHFVMNGYVVFRVQVLGLIYIGHFCPLCTNAPTEGETM